MKNRALTFGAVLGFPCVAALLLGAGTELFADEKVAKKEPAKARLTVEEARDRAKLVHEIYASTLEVMHHRYFQPERAILPARAMEDIFADIKEKAQVEAQWISVNVKAMSVNHEPKTDFEKKAAAEIGEGKETVETVEGGYYRRVGAIPLKDGCIHCHGGIFMKPSKVPKFAGLVISVPVK